MKTASIFVATALVALGLSGAVQAQERPDHFKGEASPTLEDAMANLTEYNRQLEAIVAKDTLEPMDAAEVHQLTYTLENALQKIESELEDLQQVLEEVHVASERMEFDVVKQRGRDYLDTAAKLTP